MNRICKNHLGKIMLMSVLFVMLCGAISGCSSPAKEVDKLIGSIGEVTIASEETIIAAEEAYEKLDETSKSKVKQYDVLLAARAALDEIKLEEAWENNIARRTWRAMGEVSGTDMSKAWELNGLYTFGEKTDDGELTIFVSKDAPELITGDVTFRVYLRSFSEINSRFIPMLRVLLDSITVNGLSNNEINYVNSLLDIFELAALKGKTVDFGANDVLFKIGDAEIWFKYDGVYNELYAKLSPIKDTEIWISK